MAPNLTITFLCSTKNSLIREYEFLEFSGKINKNETKSFNIDYKYFSQNNGESIDIYFYLYTENRRNKFEYYFKLFNGTNHAYCFVNGIGKTFQLLFKDERNIELETAHKIKLTKSDNNSTIDRTRYLLINYDTFI